MKQDNTIAGLSLGGGRKENFFLCLFQYFPEKQRWFLSSLKQLKEEDGEDSDEVINQWIREHELNQIIVDFPLTSPLCESCTLDCPGIVKCIHPIVRKVREEMGALLTEDRILELENPKKYEQLRNKDDEIDVKKNVLDKAPFIHILSKSFKRKLKKGFVPYWHRPLDFWVWKYYYDHLLNLFNISYDSFGNASMMLLNRFKYLRRHFPKELKMFESNVHVVLIELMRAKIVSKKDIQELSDMNLVPLARLRIVKAIENKCQLFVYENDLEWIVKHSKAFDSFLLAVAGLGLIQNKIKAPPSMGEADPRFVVPLF